MPPANEKPLEKPGGTGHGDGHTALAWLGDDTLITGGSDGGLLLFDRAVQAPCVRAAARAKSGAESPQKKMGSHASEDRTRVDMHNGHAPLAIARVPAPLSTDAASLVVVGDDSGFVSLYTVTAAKKNKKDGGEDDDGLGVDDDDDDDDDDDLVAGRRVVFKDNLTRSTLQVRDVAATAAGEGGDLVVAVASDDPGVTLVKYSAGGVVAAPRTLVAMDAKAGPVPAKSVSWDPRGEFLATLGSNGHVAVFAVDPAAAFAGADAKAKAKAEQKAILGEDEEVDDDDDDEGTDAPVGEMVCDLQVMEPAIASNLEKQCHISWHPEGAYLALPVPTGTMLLSRAAATTKCDDDAARGKLMKCEGGAIQLTTSTVAPASLVAWSPNGEYLAVYSEDADDDGTVDIFRATGGPPVVSRSVFETATACAWCPSGNVLGIALDDGTHAILLDAVTAALPAPSEGAAPAAHRASAKKKNKRKGATDMSDDSDDEDEDEVVMEVVPAAAPGAALLGTEGDVGVFEEVTAANMDEEEENQPAE